MLDRRTGAVDFDDYANITLVDATRSAGYAVAPAWPSAPAHLWFRAVDLSGAARIEVEVAREADGPASLEIHVDGQCLSEISVPGNGDRHTWTTVAADLAARLTGVHDLKLVLRGDFHLAAFRLG